jgi:hypothetical protein
MNPWREWEGMGMSTEKASGSQAYTMVAALLMVCLLTFGMLHSFGVLR